MKRLLPVAILFCLLITACEKNANTVYNIPSDYPTIYSRLQSDVLTGMRSSYAAKNPFMNTSLNDLGFTNYNDGILNVELPPYKGLITQDEAVNIVKSFAKNNRSETGVVNYNDLTFRTISSGPDFETATRWNFRSVNQHVDTVEVLYSEIIFLVTNDKVTSCLGNWFPEIYIPEQFNFSIEGAKEQLAGRIVSHYSFAGIRSDITITKADLDKCNAHLKIVPLNRNDKTEMRVCWEINLPQPVYYLIYVDVMTGDVISESPTIIS